MASEAHLRHDLSQTMAGLYRRGWCDGTGGNFSVVLNHDPLQLLMAPSGVHKGDVPPEQLIVVHGDGSVDGGQGRASAETLLHLAIVRTTGAGAVLHTHSQAATLLSQRLGRHQPAELLLEGLEMLKGLQGVTSHDAAVAVPVLPNDQDLQRLSDAASPLLAEAPHGLLIAGHGLYAWGADLGTARRHLEILEFLLEQRWRQLLLEPNDLQPRRIGGIDHVLLDIEGTTCPVSFVSTVLFPYAASHLEAYLQQHGDAPQLQQLLLAVRQAWADDGDAAKAGLVCTATGSVVPYLQWLISVDRKLTELKDLQGMIWADGYANGALKGPLFADVAPALRRWHRQGLGLSVYSSGSVAAQKLLYGHSNAGDLRPLFSGWFDTRSGPKGDSSSYQAISRQLGCPSERILFISDANAELDAARAAGLQVLFSDRPGNPQRAAAGFERITSFSTLQLST
ncbi:MAG: Enolase-phosphatase [Cyanobacteriota bacterium]